MHEPVAVVLEIDVDPPAEVHVALLGPVEVGDGDNDELEPVLRFRGVRLTAPFLVVSCVLLLIKDLLVVGGW
jgi:hypothetical protein